YTEPSKDFIISQEILPFNVLRSMHTQLAILWVAVGWLVGGLLIAPWVANKDHKYPWLVDVLWSALLVVAVGSMIGLYMGATAADNTMSALWMTWGVGFTGMAISPAWTLVQKFSPANIIGIAAGYVNGLTNVLSAFVPATIGALIALTGNYLAGMLLMVGLGIIAALAATPLMLKKY
ncbi:MAG: hypothetical protein KBD95_05355, partial [Veillonella sp.]|nr:hypothetical protein [Veillonella sp.]